MLMKMDRNALSINTQTRFENLLKSWVNDGDKWIGKQMMMEIWRGRNYGVNVNGNGEVGDEFDDKDKAASWLDMIKGWEVSGFN
ncbi:unnamed protein product [Ambrosiozyma monospora]|uniref:Unnamed protein product n=1 Tax=Ambrosiozyma monospora TaxID=43982 RepID=A0ACB5UAV7_AMBMO|nr:unnamed protein product [Ambrosiozyma monospora]